MKKIYTILENIYSDNTINVFNYDDEKLAKENFDKLVDTYKKDYPELFENENDYELYDDYLSIYEMVDIQIVENILD